MSMTDPVADFLTRIRNGLHADRDDVEMPASNFKAEIARILREQGYIEDYAVEAGTIPKVQGGMGTTIVSTSHGVMTGHEAKRAGVGGELVARVW